MSVYSQNNDFDKLIISFIDECSGSIIKPEYELMLTPVDKTKRILNYNIERGDWISQNTITIDITNLKDTVQIPKILFSTGSELHSNRWTYLNCDEVCSGKEIDYYKNGNKRLEGNFENGKPIDITIYYPKGNIETRTFFEKGTLKYTRIDYYDETGELLEYELYTNKRKKTIIKTYDKYGEFIDEQTEHLQIVSTTEQNLTCNDFKTGTFYVKSDKDDIIQTVVNRKLNSQIEHHQNSKNSVFEIIEWVDECSYRLTFDSSKMDLTEHQKMANQYNGIVISKTKIEGKCMYYKATMEMGERKITQNGKICKE